MANRLKGEVCVACLDGEERTLLFDVNAICAIEEAFGAPISDLGARLARPSARDLRTLLRAGLMAKHPEIDEAGAGRLLGLAEMADAVGAALQAAMPRRGETEAGGDADPRKAAADGTGSGS